MPTEIETLAKVCAKCTACTFMPEQPSARVLQWEFTKPIETKEKWVEAPPLVLVLDDFDDEPTEAFNICADFFGEIPFTLTSTIRCKFGIDAIESQILSAVASCSVWTKPLLEGRKLIVSTWFGLKQMGIGEHHKWGDILRSPKYGYILVVPPLEVIKGAETTHVYKPKINRLLRECGLL